MASLEKRGGIYRVVFRFLGQKYSRSLKTRSERAALACLARLEDNQRRVDLGILAVPPRVDPAAFLLSDGKLSARPQPTAISTLGKLLDDYVASVPHGSLEENTLYTISIHVKHLKRVLGASFPLPSINVLALQRYIDRRSNERRHRRQVGAITIRKELATLNSAWRRAFEAQIVDRTLPKQGLLRFPKTVEKPPFQTWSEIERKIRRGGVSKAEEKSLWECLFLTVSEIDELLQFAKLHSPFPYIYPMFVFAAHTGARRSEMMRAEIDDVNVVRGQVLIRERKRTRGKATTRRVALSPLLQQTLSDWFLRHPGGKFLFCHRTEGRAPAGLTNQHARDHFKRTVAQGKWKKLRGWHVFRHSFCSNCAAAGIDQRIINAWVGHQTEEMVRRYRHLVPNQEQAAIRQVFGQ